MAKGLIPQSDIQAIRERTPIEEIVGEYVELKPAGADSLKGLSPFKDEKTPSFHVRPAHGYYHCFSSDKGGDVFNFLMEMEHLTFPEAVEACAEKIGYRINYQGGSTGARREEPGTRKRLIDANRAAHKFYREQLETPEAKTARDFLLKRGFSKEHIYTFECGYAPDGWDTMTKHLLKQGFSVKELEAAGLSTIGRRGPIDRFHRRLLWPIKNVSGDVIGFGARKLFDDDNLGKYMNTPETLLYKKSKVLFGLDQAKKAIASSHQAVVVEGYTDVMAMHAAGVKTAVASCGTAFGEEHLQVLRRYLLDDSYFVGSLVYTFDGDEAGQKAAMRAYEGGQEFTGQSYVAVAPEGMDPCDLRLEKGDAAVRDLVARRIPMYEFIIQALIDGFDLDSAEGRVQALNRAVPVVAGIRDQALKSEYARRLAGWVGWPDPAEVMQKVRQEERRPKKPQRPRAQRFDSSQNAPTRNESMLVLPNRRDPRLWPQREALKIALQEPRVASDYFDGLPEDAFDNEAYAAVRRAIAAAGGAAEHQPGPTWIGAVNDQMHDIVGKALISELAVEALDGDVEELNAHVDRTLTRLQEQLVGNQIAVLKGQLQRMRPSEKPEEYRAMFADLVALEEARRELIDRVFR
ncbi:DNA primase [Corynebacterium pseudopelargi]|uniref:DNA primase n=1 Tax=Corynebacterium pseudopelargi TaxID=2080757 RepID=A0A3G6IT43_9CORY|nr:DNA primase [Corynebacterium pseudopelargi]AZA08831.1 DNA primase [Corynebacterium pseudopelargi]